jgi:hypothetical protein
MKILYLFNLLSRQYPRHGFPARRSGGNCLEIAASPRGIVMVRDSRQLALRDGHREYGGAGAAFPY